MSPSNGGHDTADRPNVVVICADQWRGDCLSSEGHPHVKTPHLDELARDGTRFSKAYSATPTCVPARVALLTGQSQERHGRVGYEEGVPFDKAHPETIAKEFSKAGYQTQAIGKMHVYPERTRAGFDDVILHDGFLHHSRGQHKQDFRLFDDYVPWLRRQPGVSADEEYFDHGVNCNSVVARPWDKEERLHPSSWLAGQTIEWVHRRDPTRPFFLYLSFHRPHPPYDPPSWAFDQYLNMPQPDAITGDWEHHWEDYRRDGDHQAAFGSLDPALVHRAKAGYYGLMTHIDLQINRILESMADFGLRDNTIVVFTSDHGEMMGDHHMFRKALPYEGSARIPLIIAAPGSAQPGREVDQVVELRDIMPTLLDLAGLEIPHSVDGRSLAGPVTGDTTDEPVREYLHGEHVYFGQSIQWLTDGHKKYIWGSASGVEELFDLDTDPMETTNLADVSEYASETALWRERLIQVLTGREEGFVANDCLQTGVDVVTSHRRVRDCC